MNKALNQLINNKGYEFLKNPMIINILGDYNAFNEYHSSKFIFKTLVNEGYLEKILFLHENQKQIDVDNYIAELYDKYGLRKDVCHYVLNSLLLGLGYDVVLNNNKANNEVVFEKNSIKPIITGEHLSFKGVEINGSIDEMRMQLENKGFTFITNIDNGIILSGDFAGFSNCEIIVTYSPYIDLVWRVIVLLPQKSQWYDLKAEYIHCKELYTKKYGKPQSYEYFTSPYEEGDGYEMTAVSSENCSYASYFETPLGFVVVRISTDERVVFVYEDKCNSDLDSEARNNQADLDI